MVDELDLQADSGNTEYSTRSMLKLYLYMLVKRITGFKTLAELLRRKEELLDQFWVDGPASQNDLEPPLQATAPGFARADSQPSRGLCG